MIWRSIKITRFYQGSIITNYSNVMTHLALYLPRAALLDTVLDYLFFTLANNFSISRPLTKLLAKMSQKNKRIEKKQVLSFP